jgi:lactate dehydrogenase-like 2-hydroxyacid dehydrogenase
MLDTRAKPRVVVTRHLPEAVEGRLAATFGAVLNPTDEQMSPTELADAVRGADGLLVAVTDRMDADVLGATPRRAGIVANFGAGYNHIDLDAARDRDIVVTNTPGVLTDDTADLAMTLMLMAARRAGEGERHVRSGAWTGWRPTQLLGTRLTGATLGIIGLGRIGQAVAHRAIAGFGMRVLAYQPRPVTADGLDVRHCASLDELLAASDVVSVHCPATPTTRHLIDARALAVMRPEAILINTARGDVVDEAALAAALRGGHLAGAGLDVYEREPQIDPGLLALENVVLLPHLGSATRQSREAMGMRAIDNLIAFFAGGEPPDRVV